MREVAMRRNQNVVKRERYEQLHAMLAERRRDIHEKLRSLRETLPAEASEVRDAEEQSVDDFVQDVDFALMEMKSETLRRIDDALRRLDEGGYGYCGDCSSEISASRLKALPFAELCRDCQEARERAQQEAHELAHRATRTTTSPVAG
jgi:DnaK suppressor protein